MKLYHGTLASRVPAILREGLRPRGENKSHDEYIDWPSRPEMVYLTSNMDNGLHHAYRISEREASRAAYGEPVSVLEIDMDALEESRFYPDEDYLVAEWSSNFRDWTSEDQASFMECKRDTWNKSLEMFKVVAYKGTVPAEAISVHRHSELSERIKREMLRSKRGRA